MQNMNDFNVVFKNTIKKLGNHDGRNALRQDAHNVALTEKRRDYQQVWRNDQGVLQ
jgi:hypothetical protein